jgi:DNA-binding MurR/RpiR family transcriptional regulator
VIQNQTLFERIHSSLPTMSEAKRNVGQYLLENWQEAAFHPAARLARNVGVSESVVVRFAQDLGYSGFPDLQGSLQKILQGRLTAISRINERDGEPTGIAAHSTDDPLQKVLDLSMKNLQEVQLNNPAESFEKVVQLIFDAERVAIVAGRNASGPAKILAVHLNEVFTNTVLISSGQDDLFDQLRSLSGKDLLLTIGLTRYTRRTVQASEFAAERGIPQVAITDSMRSPLAAPALVTLLTHNRSYSFASSHLTTVFIIDVLTSLITVKGKGRVLKSLEEIEIINQRYGLSILE